MRAKKRVAVKAAPLLTFKGNGSEFGGGESGEAENDSESGSRPRLLCFVGCIPDAERRSELTWG